MVKHLFYFYLTKKSTNVIWRVRQPGPVISHYGLRVELAKTPQNWTDWVSKWLTNLHLEILRIKKNQTIYQPLGVRGHKSSLSNYLSWPVLHEVRGGMRSIVLCPGPLVTATLCTGSLLPWYVMIGLHDLYPFYILCRLGLIKQHKSMLKHVEGFCLVNQGTYGSVSYNHQWNKAEIGKTDESISDWIGGLRYFLL